MTPKNCFVKDLYEVLVARDVRLIFKDQEALKGDVCKHGKVAPVDSSVIIGVIYILSLSLHVYFN